MSDTTPRLDLIQRAMQRAKRAAPEPAPVTRTEPIATIAAAALSADRHSEPAVQQTASVRTGANEVALNYAHLREAKIVLPGDRNSVTFNEFRGIKRKLLPMASRARNDHRIQNVVMVSSALPGEGKTFTSLNLAITLAAEKNLNVILVDGDVIRSSVGQYFIGQTGRGLLDLFGNNQLKIDEVLHRCQDVPNLQVVFSGSQNDAAPEMFASARMAEICDSFSRRFNNCIVIIDSPPVLATSEPASLVTHIDHLIMVVAAGRASNHQVETAISSLSSCHSIYLLFNKAPKWQRPSPGSYYYYSPAP
jgi:receptor protein-tyrosine kinase